MAAKKKRSKKSSKGSKKSSKKASSGGSKRSKKKSSKKKKSDGVVPLGLLKSRYQRLGANLKAKGVNLDSLPPNARPKSWK